LDEIITDDAGGRSHVCSDSDYCQTRQDEAGQIGGAVKDQP
jgi:alpha-D-ribose 1-methylphosphonate 5-phosphate C-P lyase